ncbi:hypothetical protein KIW84_032606 [Lathyrus oleraceus]|uniref:Secreted protein n=1 Tax=Pisum sativum TaxID=3888 RepID=A0A9D4XUD2_PEA|nr:hypothetical protein KIW84_032606 [Pisum sativum]
MAMALNAAIYIAKMTWLALAGWITSCLTVADEFASSLRSGDIGPFQVLTCRCVVSGVDVSVVHGMLRKSKVCNCPTESIVTSAHFIDA